MNSLQALHTFDNQKTAKITGFGLPVGVLFPKTQVSHCFETDQKLHGGIVQQGLHRVVMEHNEAVWKTGLSKLSIQLWNRVGGICRANTQLLPHQLTAINNTSVRLLTCQCDGAYRRLT